MALRLEINQQLPLERFLFYLERFILIGALLFSGALLFFLHSAFLMEWGY